MGFRKEPTVYKLTFGDYDGLEVTVKSLSVEELLKLTELAGNVDASNPANSIENSKALLQKFSDCLVSWNLEDETGKPVPANYKGVSSQELPFILEIIMEWMNSVATVSPNLEKRLNTTQSLEQLPMEAL